MAVVSHPSGYDGKILAGLAKRFVVILGLALLFFMAAGFVQHPFSKIGLSLAGGSLCCVAVFIKGMQIFQKKKQDQAFKIVSEFIAHDSSVTFVTDADGVICHHNNAARQRFGRLGTDLLGGVLREVFANPGAIIFKLLKQVELAGTAREDIVTRRGHVRLSLTKFAPDKLLWRLEEMADRQASTRSGESAHLPTITVGRNDAILFMSDSARKLIGERAKSLDRVFPDLPLCSGHNNRVSAASGVVNCLVVVIATNGGRREIFLLPPHETTELQSEDWSIFDDLPVPLLKLDPSGDILMANRGARALLGVTNAHNLRLPELMEGLGRSIVDWLSEAAQGRGVQHSEVLRLSRSDREVFVQVTLSSVRDEDGLSLIAVLNDATELKTLEAQFVQSQKMQAIGQLAGGVAHDFNNLLTAISGHCDLLLLRHDRGDPDFADLVQINQNANRAAGLVGQLLAFSRKQTLRPEVLDVRDTLSDLAHLLNRLVGEKVTLSLSHDPILRAIRADKRQLEQVLMNLVVNARDAMPQGGEIRIETESYVLSDPLKRDRAVVAPGNYVSIKVSDAGTGIATDKLQKIFEPFYTTKRTGEGTGLGLSTVYGIVKQSGGFIFVDSELEKGTCFTVLFPAHDTPAEIAKSPGIETAALAMKHTDGVVLLVEDEAPVRAFASRALRLRGYTVLEAESAEEALKTLEDTSLVIDVFVTDVVMPGMDGPSWVRKALKERPDVRVVFVSGYAEDAFIDAQARIPNSVFLPKPFSLIELTETVQSQLH